MEIPLVTDDKNMIKTCKDHGIKVFSTLHLLKLMLDEKFIDFNMINEIIDYWKYENDLPTNLTDFEKDIKRLFRNL